MSSITWSQIETECGNFRDGFVATFRKYQGQDTDERDPRGVIVKVTMGSFARHMGISPRTFERWVSNDVRTVSPEQKTTERARIASGQARLLPPSEKAKLAAELMADPEVADEIADEITTFVASDPIRTAHVISKRRESDPRLQHIEQPEQRPRRDYDAMVEQWVNLASVTFAAESAGTWTPNEHSEALLYFISQIVGKRSEPTGENAEFVNEKLESLFSEAEAYANSEVS